MQNIDAVQCAINARSPNIAPQNASKETGPAPKSGVIVIALIALSFDRYVDDNKIQMLDNNITLERSYPRKPNSPALRESSNFGEIVPLRTNYFIYI